MESDIDQIEAAVESLKLVVHRKTGYLDLIEEDSRWLVKTESDYYPARNVIYAIGGSISPVCMESQGPGTIQERKHSNLIFTAVRDASVVMSAISAAD